MKDPIKTLSIRKSEALALLKVWEKHHQSMAQLQEQLRALFDHAPESRVSMELQAGLGFATALLARLLAKGEWGLESLEWWVWENDFGRKGLGCGFGDDPEEKLIPMKTIEDYLDFMWQIEQ